MLNDLPYQLCIACHWRGSSLVWRSRSSRSWEQEEYSEITQMACKVGSIPSTKCPAFEVYTRTVCVIKWRKSRRAIEIMAFWKPNKITNSQWRYVVQTRNYKRASRCSLILSNLMLALTSSATTGGWRTCIFYLAVTTCLGFILRHQSWQTAPYLTYLVLSECVWLCFDFMRKWTMTSDCKPTCEHISSCMASGSTSRRLRLAVTSPSMTITMVIASTDTPISKRIDFRLNDSE